MVSENQSGNLDSGSLQFLQFPTMVATDNTPKKKLKIKIASKRIEAEPGIESYEYGKRVFTNDERDQSIPMDKNSKFEMNESHKKVIFSSGDTKMYAPGKLNVISSVMGSHKHRLLGVEDGQKEKRRKMDRSVARQCSSILKQLMTHRSGWVFNHPVDPVKLNIPDYFSIISEPMDLGTIKTKLDNNAYSSVDEFAADVRLTFSNAMVYNHPSNNVYHMAEKLNDIFNTRWKCFEAKWNLGHANVEQGHTSCGKANNTNNPGQNGSKTSTLHASLLPKMLMSAGEKQKLRKQLSELSREKMPPHLQSFLKKFGFNCQREGRIDVDIDALALDEETFFELKRIIRSSLGARAAKVETAKKTENGCRQSIGKIILKGTDSGNRNASGSANPPLNLVTPKCGLCGSMRCLCSLQSDFSCESSSDLTSERSLGQEHFDASRWDHEAKSLSASQMIKSDLDSDGAARALDEEHFFSSPQFSIIATTSATASGEGLTQLIDIQLSPKKALRAAMLKSRFADTILKAKQKTFLDNVDEFDPVKMRQETERLERQQREEKARIEAQIRAAEAASQMRAETELKKQREREREAARLAVQKMEKTVEFNSLEILKDIEMLTGCSLSNNLSSEEVVLGSIEALHFCNPLEQLGLFIKDDYMELEDDEAILNGDGEEGEIFS